MVQKRFEPEMRHIARFFARVLWSRKSCGMSSDNIPQREYLSLKSLQIQDVSLEN